MADTNTTNLNLVQPEVGSSQDSWGGKLNNNASIIDAVFSATGTSVAMNIDGANIDSSPIGATTPSTGAFTSLSATGDLTVDTSTLKVDSTNNRVGVNTATPGYPLHIVGSTIGLFNSGADATIYLGEGESGGQYGWIKWESSDDTIRIGTQAGGDTITVNESGAVGIGNTLGSFHSSVLPLIVGSGSGDEGMAIFSGSSNKGKLGFADAATDDSGSYRGYLQYDHSGDNLNIGTAGSERLRIDSSGKVGIGTSSPARDMILVTEGATNGFRIESADESLHFFAANGSSGTAVDDAIYLGYSQGTQKTQINANGVSFLNGGSVGIGNTDPGGMHSMVNRLVVGSGSGNQGLAIYSGAGNEGAIGFARAIAANTDAYDGLIEYSQADRSMRFGTNAGAERMRLKTGLAIGSSTDPGSGNLYVADSVLISRSSQFSPASKLVVSAGATGGTTPACSFQANTSTSSGSVVVFYKGNGGEVASIGMSNLNAGTSVSYNTGSDARWKDVTGEARGLEVINNLNPVAFNWKETGTADEGLIAQEVQEHIPNIVHEGNNGYLQMDYSKLVTPLIKAVQELSAEVEQLKQQAHEKCEN